LTEVLSDTLTAPFRRLNGKSPRNADFWALRDVSFDAQPGEALGIIGRNGAGKSTLLKIMSRITEPTEGEIILNGRVGSLLEVGTGFHPELTGRENIYLNGAILGMSRDEIRHKFDEIVAFAEIDQFIETPAKRYSSGMYMRLAFAVAAHLEPEILMVDEVLAVGDAAFQKKCLAKMGEVAGEGRTVLFVSHNMVALQSMCSRAILLKNGSVIMQGNVSEVVNHYLQKEIKTGLEQDWNDVTTAPGNEKVRLRSARVVPELTESREHITVETPITLEFEFWSLLPNATINLSVVLWSQTGECIFNVVTEAQELNAGLHQGQCLIPGNLLNDNLYTVQLYIVKDRSVILHKHDDILSFEVEDVPRLHSGWYGKWIGAVRPQLDFSLRTLELSQA
jgi:lipopolysaccharide transport system ATP-binding protein